MRVKAKVNESKTSLLREGQTVLIIDDLVTHGGSILASLLFVTVANAAGGEDAFEAFRARMHDAPTPQEQDRYRGALARFRDPALMERLLALTVSDEVRPQDAPFLLSRAEANRDLGAIAWRYVRDHWEELLPRFAASNVLHLAVGARTLTDPELVAEVQAFFAEHDIPQNHRSLVQAMERQRVMAAMRERSSGELAARFSS